MLSAKEAAKQTKAAKKPNTEYLATLSKVEKLIDEQLKYATPTVSTHIPADHSVQVIKKLRDRGYAVTRKSSTFIIITWKNAIKNEAFESLKTSKSRIEKLVELPILRNVKAGRNSVEIGFEKHTHVGDFFYVLIRTLEEAGYTVIQSSCGLRIKIAW